MGFVLGRDRLYVAVGGGGTRTLSQLHGALFARDGLQHGERDVAFLVTDWLAEALLDLNEALRHAPALFAVFPGGYNTAYDFCLQLWTRGAALFDPAGRLLLAAPAAQTVLESYRRNANDPATVHLDCQRFDSVRSGMAFARAKWQ